MRVTAVYTLGREVEPLMHTKSVLFIHYNQTQTTKYDFILK
jgi:hypothetical protein